MHDFRHPVLLLHTLGAAGETWAEVIGADQSRFSAPDLPGHGMRRDEVFDTAKAVATCLETGPRFHVAGSGLGAYVALELLRAAPERVASLVLAGFPAAGGPERVASTAKLLAEQGVEGFAASYMKATLYMGATPRLGAARTDSAPHADGPAPTPSQEVFAQAFLAMRPEGLLSALAAALSWRLPEARTRTTVLRGEHDVRVGEEAARSLAAALGADYVTLPLAGHVAYVDDPRGFREVLDAFHRATEAQEEH
ncbi:alpha/beta hydrolase [Herbidospora sp. NBRC 101105]|uniref:alpha/beta fold hydrolase n=1 Tax=Herbidospora sp. NBRC 101105 TaxID=3032195 RepID=UPI00249FB2F1|nr:alpha/beta hydrolase [Herbidospora sp. NBRC 101105]GLX94667.1 alpha/beta hydrolase [Herbidospora sp. NBRC 101105]